MKKFLAILVLLLFATSPVRAQTPGDPYFELDPANYISMGPIQTYYNGYTPVYYAWLKDYNGIDWLAFYEDPKFNVTSPYALSVGAYDEQWSLANHTQIGFWAGVTGSPSPPKPADPPAGSTITIPTDPQAPPKGPLPFWEGGPLVPLINFPTAWHQGSTFVAVVGGYSYFAQYMMDQANNHVLVLYTDNTYQHPYLVSYLKVQ